MVYILVLAAPARSDTRVIRPEQTLGPAAPGQRRTVKGPARPPRPAPLRDSAPLGAAPGKTRRKKQERVALPSLRGLPTPGIPGRPRPAVRDPRQPRGAAPRGGSGLSPSAAAEPGSAGTDTEAQGLQHQHERPGLNFY